MANTTIDLPHLTSKGNKEMAMKTAPSRASAASSAATTAAPAVKKRSRYGPAPTESTAMPDVSQIHVSAKKQKLEQVSAIAKDVMLALLQGELSYDVHADEWERLVTLTQQHPSFAKHYTFPAAASEPGWVTPKKKIKATHLRIVALDCEMCVTAPRDNAIDRKSNALCRVSAVNGEDLIRGLVADLIVHQPEPGYRMVDAKTDIHGITMAMIDQSKISVEKAQKHLLKYINADTILVGHSLQGDLASLRINHTRVIDTAKIFQRKGGDTARATPGLKCLTKFLLGFEMPDGHDSTIDAQASMLAAKHAVRNACGAIIPSMLELHGPRADTKRGTLAQYDGPPKIVASGFQLNNLRGVTETTQENPVEGPVGETTRVPMNRPPPPQVLEARSCQLRIHHIPRGVTASDIETFFVDSAKIVPAAVETPLWKTPTQKHGASHATFTTPLHAALAFDAMVGKPEPLDAIGRPQKLVAITTSKGKKFKGIKVGTM